MTTYGCGANKGHNTQCTVDGKAVGQLFGSGTVLIVRLGCGQRQEWLGSPAAGGWGAWEGL